MESKQAKFTIGQVVKHRVFPFRGVIFDVDPVFSNTEEWYEAIPAEVRPASNPPALTALRYGVEARRAAAVLATASVARSPEAASCFDPRPALRP